VHLKSPEAKSTTNVFSEGQLPFSLKTWIWDLDLEKNLYLALEPVQNYPIG